MKRYLWALSLIIMMVFSASSFSQTRKDKIYSEEPIVMLNLKESSINIALTQILNSQTDLVSDVVIKLDPLTRIMIVEGTINASLKSLLKLDSKDLDHYSKEQQPFRLALRFPKMQQLDLNWFVIDILELSLNNKSFINLFDIVGEFASVVLMNTELINYVLEGKAAQDDAGDNPTKIMKLLKLKKYIRISSPPERSGIRLSIKLDTNMFNANEMLKGYDLGDIRLWHMSPYLYNGTTNVLRVEIGPNYPQRKDQLDAENYWYDTNKKRIKRNDKIIKKNRASEYVKYSYKKNRKAILNELHSYMDQQTRKRKLRYVPAGSEKNALERLRDQTLRQRMEKQLTVSNILFKADPEGTYQQYMKEAKMTINCTLADVKRTLRAKNLIRKGGAKGNSEAIITKRVSQDAFSMAMNFVRDLDVEGYYPFKDIEVILEPSVPGINVRGIINTNIQEIISNLGGGLIREGKKFPKVHGTINPLSFEIQLGILLEDEGWLNLDLHSFKIFSKDSGDFRIDHTDENSAFILEFVKLLAAQHLSKLKFNTKESEVITPEEQKRLVQENQKRILAQLKQLQTNYSQISNSSVLDYMDLDIKKDPFAMASVDFIKHKKEILLKDVIKYENGFLKIKLDPRLVADNISGADNSFQVWNLMPIFSSDYNNTFLELAVGSDIRSRGYVDSLYNRKEYKESMEFNTQLGESMKSNMDLQAIINADHFTETANTMMSQMLESDNKEMLQKLKENSKQEYKRVLRNVELRVSEDNKLYLEVTYANFKRKKKGGIFQKPKWVTEENTIVVEIQIGFASKSLAEVKDRIKAEKLKNGVLLSDQFLAVSFKSLKVKFGDSSFWGLISKVGIKDGLLTDTLIKVLANQLNESKKSKKRIMAGHPINEMIKLLATKDGELLIQLNPRLAGPAFDLFLAPTEKRKRFTSKGIMVNAAKDEVRFSFSVSAGLAQVDKYGLKESVAKMDRLLKPLLDSRSRESLIQKLRKTQLFENVFANLDSPYVTMASIAGKYYQINSIATFDDVYGFMDLNHLIRFTNAKGKLNGKITASGVELGYFLAVANNIYQNLKKFESKVQALDLVNICEDFRYDHFVKMRKKIYRNVLKPLLDKYEKSFHLRNSKIVKQRITYWNYQYYADAMFAEHVYKKLK